MNIDLTCDCCNQNKAFGVCSSALGPVSLAYCSECLEHRADAEFMFAATFESCGNEVADWVRDLSTYRNGEYIKWSDWVSAQGMSAEGQDPQGLGATPASPVGNADAPKEIAP